MATQNPGQNQEAKKSNVQGGIAGMNRESSENKFADEKNASTHTSDVTDEADVEDLQAADELESEDVDFSGTEETDEELDSAGVSERAQKQSERQSPNQPGMQRSQDRAGQSNKANNENKI